MHMKHSGEEHGPPIVPVKFVLEDPEGLTSTEQSEWDLMGGEGENLLELAIEHGINIESDDDEEDRVEEAPGLQVNSRLACQCKIEGTGPLTVRVPAWNRNAVKEVPH